MTQALTRRLRANTCALLLSIDECAIEELHALCHALGLSEVADLDGASRPPNLSARAERRILSSLRRDRTAMDQTVRVGLEWHVALAERDLVHRSMVVANCFAMAPIGLVARVLLTLIPATEHAIQRWLRNLAGRRARLVDHQSISGHVLQIERALIEGTAWGMCQGMFPVAPFAPTKTATNGPAPRWSWLEGRYIPVDSRLEGAVLAALDSSELVRRIIEQPTVVPLGSDAARRYFPDFGVLLRDGRAIVIEVKPQARWADSDNRSKWAAARVYCGERGWGFLVTDGERWLP